MKIDKKHIIFILVIILVIGLFSIYKSISTLVSKKEAINNNYDKSNQILNINNEDNKKVENIKDENKKDDELDYGNKNAPLISKAEATIIIDKARQFIRNAQWDNAYALIQDTVNKYNLDTEEGKIIQTLYYDATLALNLKGAEYKMYKNIISGIKDPENLLCIVLQIPEELRRDIIVNEDSLSPIVDPPLIVNSISEEKGEMFQYASYIKNMDKMYKIDFIADSIPLEAYIIKFKEGNIKLYMIKAKDGVKHYFKTIKQWKDIDEMIDKNMK